jgi:bifunctional non-homologous end joining protein LigD
MPAARCRRRSRCSCVAGQRVGIALIAPTPTKSLDTSSATTNWFKVQKNAFDILVEGGEDLRRLPLHMRKANLERLLARRPEGIFVNPFERGEIGPDLFRAACRMGLEGLVTKHRDRPYQAGRSKHWVKVKNRKHPAMERVLE